MQPKTLAQKSSFDFMSCFTGWCNTVRHTLKVNGVDSNDQLIVCIVANI